MFSGIIEEAAVVVALRKEQENLHLTMTCSFVDELKIDQSVAHNGVCLTVVDILGEKVEIPEKLQEFMKGEKQSEPMTKNFADFKAYLLGKS